MNHLAQASVSLSRDSRLPCFPRFSGRVGVVITGVNCLGYNGHDVNQQVTNMHQLTAAALGSIIDIWAAIHTEAQDHSEPSYMSSLWRMAGNSCTAYALQHQTAGDHEAAEQFNWLASIAAEQQLMAMAGATEPLKPEPLKLAIVQSLNGVQH